MEDYSYLAGRVIEYKYDKSWPTTTFGIVVGVDESVGITIVERYNKNHNLLCLNGPSTKYFKENRIKQENYDACFKIIVEMLKNDFYQTDETINCLYFGWAPDHYISYSDSEMASCPYSGE